MRKEVIFAIIIGLVLGGIILYGMQLANQSAKEAASATGTPGAVVAPAAPTPAVESKLTIAEPLNHAVVNTSTIKISGKTIPASTIAVESTEDDMLVTADAAGNFSTNIKLAGGENLIKITTLLPDQKTATIEVSVIYSTVKLASPVPTGSTDTPVATDSQTLLEKTYEDVLQKAKDNSKQTEEVLDAKADRNRLVGYAGSISDIKQGVFSLNSRDTTLQVSYNTSTAIIKDGSALKPELIALADRAIVIGNLTGPDIVAAKRIVIFKETAPKFTKKTILSPIVKIDAKKKTLTLKVDDKNLEVALGKLIKFDLTTLTLDQKIFGIIMTGVDSGTSTLIQGKII
ncbi:MAG: hypothetical protein AAB548_00015 [Patescibacteria group bacterium]